MGRLYAQNADIETKLKAYVVNGECWEHQACVNDKGYPLLMYQNKFWYLHRLAYVRWVGPIPEGMTVDHTCFNTRCINPKHLRLLTLAENAKIHREPQIKEFCLLGHRKEIKPWGRNVCDICSGVNQAKYRKKRHSARLERE